MSMNSKIFLSGAALLVCSIFVSCASTNKKSNEEVTVAKYDMPVGMHVSIGDKSLATSFPDGFNLAAGSGLTYIGKDKKGNYTFWGITDRGPNIDSPSVEKDGIVYASKIFASPNFTPSYVRITAGKNGVTFDSPITIKTSEGKCINGLPLPFGTVGATDEIALDVNLNEIASSPDGLDTEAIMFDKDKKYVWISDEYGPFAVKVELATGKIVQKLVPGKELPSIIAKRIPNRGAEGIAVTPNGKVYIMVQSILDDLSVKSSKSKALFCRIIEYNPANGTTRQLAYPIDTGYKKQADCKLGDLVAIDNTHFLVIEQGKRADKQMYNLIYKLDISNATDISNLRTSDGQELEAASDETLQTLNVQMISKTFVMNLRAYGWNVEKAEGLAYIDSKTIAVSSDNDFGIETKVENPLDGNNDPTAYVLKDGKLYLGDKEAPDTKLTAIPNNENGKLWIFTFNKKF